MFASLVATLNTCPLAALTKLTPSPSSPTAQPTTPRLVSFRLSWSLFLDTGALGFEGQFCYQLPAGLDGAGLGRLTGGQSRVATQHQVRKKAENVIFLPSPVSSTSTLCMCRDTSQSRAICWCSLSTHSVQCQGELELLNIPSYQPGHRLLVIHTAPTWRSAPVPASW